MSDRTRYYEQIEKLVLPGLNDEQAALAKDYMRRIVDGWLDQLDSGDAVTPQDLIDAERDSFAAKLGDKSGAERLAVLQNMLLSTRVDELSRRALDLAVQVVDRKQKRSAVLETAVELEAQILALMEEVQAIEDAALQKPLMRKLSDGLLEMRYLQSEDGAMSIRLNRYIESKK
jgi:hypothetical protein